MNISPDTVGIKRLHTSAQMPVKAHESDSGYDLRAVLDAAVVLQPFQRMIVPTGIALQLPRFVEAQVRPRSGLAAKFGVTVLNTPGTIDSTYRGEVGVILINLSNEPFSIQPGDRIAQLVFSPVMDTTLVPVLELDTTARGDGGFGSTGRR